MSNDYTMFGLDNWKDLQNIFHLLIILDAGIVDSDLVL